MDLAREVNSLERQAEAWNTLSDIYESTNRGPEALKAFKNHVQLRDSIASEENKAEVARKEMKFQMEKREALATAELKRERLMKNAAIAGGVILLLTALFGYWSYKRRRDASTRQQTADFKTKVAETELKALLSQMNPHFIFNALNSISDYVSQHNAEKANHYLTKFAHLMRMILESSEKKEITLEEDLKLIETYMEIESLRLNKKLSYEIDVDPGVDASNTLVPPLILQPFVENSIWHGISKKEGPGKICLEIRQVNNSLIYSVDDDGVGRNSVVRQNGNHDHSMGSRISQNRVDIINTLKGTKGSIEIIDKPQGLRVEVKLPLELAF